MLYGISDKNLEIINSIFKKYQGINKVFLYGSRAKGNYRIGSDIDLALEINSLFNNNDLLKIAGDFDDSIIPHLVDVLIYDKINNLDLKAHIDRVGKIIYQC